MLIIFLLPLLFALQKIELLTFLSAPFEPLHDFCLKRLPLDASFPITSSLMCSERLQNREWIELLSGPGLIRAVTLNLSLLMSLEIGFSLGSQTKLKSSSRWIFALVLSFFLLMSSWPLHLLRSVISVWLTCLSQWARWAWPLALRILVSSLITCTLSVQGWTSVSLLIGAAAPAVYLLVQELFPMPRDQFLVKILVLRFSIGFLTSLPYFYEALQISPLALLFGGIVTPFLGGLWLLNSILVFLIPPLSFLFVLQLDFEKKILSSCKDFFSYPPFNDSGPVSLRLWIYTFFLLSLSFELRKQRRQTG